MRGMAAFSPFTQLIEKLTVAGLSKAIEAPYQTVSAWKQRGSIPSDRWPQVIKAAGAQGIDLTLEAMHAWPKPKRKKSKRVTQ